MDRFSRWCDMLPSDHTILGLDEHTGIVIDFATGIFSIRGVSSATVLHDCIPELYPAGSSKSVDALGVVNCPASLEKGIPAQVWDMMRNKENSSLSSEIPDEIMHLLEERQAARNREDWEASDEIRKKISVLGWQVQDTPEGQKVIKD